MPSARATSRALARRRGAVRLTAAGLGVALGLGVLGLAWPRKDRSLAPETLESPADLAKPPARPVTVLVVGVDADRLTDPSNGAAPPGPANSDALLMVQVQPAGPLQVLEIPIELPVQLPGQSKPQALGSLYRQGGVALVADAVRELLGLPPGQPDRYAVVGRATLRQLVDGLDRLDVSPPIAMRYVDQRQKLRIDLQAGLQRFDGQQIEQLVRFRSPTSGEAGRRAQHQLVLRSLLRELALPLKRPLLAGLGHSLLPQTQTNLTEGELLSLLAAGLSQHDGVQITAFPSAASGTAPPVWPSSP